MYNTLKDFQKYVSIDTLYSRLINETDKHDNFINCWEGDENEIYRYFFYNDMKEVYFDTLDEIEGLWDKTSYYFLCENIEMYEKTFAIYLRYKKAAARLYTKLLRYFDKKDLTY